MNIDIKAYSYSKIKTFVNLRYLSMRISDLIFKMLSYFAYNFLMVSVITLQIFTMQAHPLEGFSFVLCYVNCNGICVSLQNKMECNTK